MLTKRSFSFFTYLPTITHRPSPCEIRFRPGKTAIRNLSMDSAFSCSIPDPIHTPRVVCFGASNSMDRYTRLMVYISGTRLNNLDGDFITTSCTPPFQMLDDRFGRRLLAYLPLGLCHDIPRCLISACTIESTPFLFNGRPWMTAPLRHTWGLYPDSILCYRLALGNSGDGTGFSFEYWGHSISWLCDR